MDNRKEFERRVKSEWSDSYSFDCDDNGDYHDEVLYGMWWGWQASRQALEGKRDPVMEVECECGDFYRANSFGAGFIAGTGMCENCAAITCTHPAKEAKGRIEGDKSGYGRIADPALEGEAVYVLLSHNPDSPESTFVEIETEAGVSVSVPWHLYDGFSRVGPLYTHPASAENAKDNAVMQAQMWAQEARTQKAIVKEIGEMVGCANDWEMVESVRNALATLPPNEHGKNRYGLDMAYFRNLFNRELNRPLSDFRPDELARVLARASRTADASVLSEPEFCVSQSAESETQTDLQRTDERTTLGQRKAAQVGTTIGVLVQNQEGRVCAVTDLGRCTWLSEDVTGAGVCLCGEVKWQDCPLHGSKQEQSE